MFKLRRNRDHEVNLRGFPSLVGQVSPVQENIFMYKYINPFCLCYWALFYLPKDTTDKFCLKFRILSYRYQSICCLFYTKAQPRSKNAPKEDGSKFEVEIGRGGERE